MSSAAPPTAAPTSDSRRPTPAALHRDDRRIGLHDPTPDPRFPTPAAPLRESDLHALWLDQRFPPDALVTVSGEPVRVLYRGRPGGGAGPDFRDARISVGGASPQLGDVELHVSEPEFRRHGHASDPAYGRVVLHVVFDAAGAAVTRLPGGGSAPVVALRPWVVQRAAEIRAWLERQPPWREPCHTAVHRLGAEAVRTALREGGERRLRAKAVTLAGELGRADAEHVLYRAVCRALGLTRNVEPFGVLADRLPLPRALDAVAGMPDDAATRHLGARLCEAAGFGPSAPPLGALPWRLDGLRPNAHPARRIDGLAAILVRCRDTGFEAAIRRAAADGAPTLLRTLTAPGIGRDRAVEVAVNAVLPFLLAIGEEGRAIALAAALPAAADYGPLAVLSAALVDETGGRPLVMAGALMQQGALALHQEWCRRGGCGICPLS
jgi:hypothetical protein